MIPADVVSRLQLTADAAVTRVPSVQQVADALGELVPGQRVLAEIQALLPNGAYRALINQRDVTLALPFSAKAGDSLELEVVDSDGKLTLAVIARKEAGGTQAATTERPSVDTTLSRTGSFIASLSAEQSSGKSAKPAVLNGQQPISPAPPQRGEDFVPLLKQALAGSGMFYESHQSQWIAARLPTEALLAQPQGKLSPLLAAQESIPVHTAASDKGTVIGPAAPAAAGDHVALQGGPAQAGSTSLATQVAAGNSIVAPDLVPLVQQQLEALATQNYVWQGQAWPGQPMQWEIIEEDAGRRTVDEASAPQWQTRLTLTMPSLGEIKATLALSGNNIAVSLATANDSSASRLQSAGSELRRQLEASGLAINSLAVTHHEPTGE